MGLLNKKKKKNEPIWADQSQRKIENQLLFNSV